MPQSTFGRVRPLLLSALMLSSFPASAALTLNAAPTLSDMRLILDGPGLAIENLQITKGIKNQYGIFTGGIDPAGADPILGIDTGLFMSTGNLSSILGPNSNQKYTFNTTLKYADPDLTQLAATAIYDPAIIEFDIIPEGDRINFLLVFGSDEYPEYVCSKFNDVFGLFISGPGLSGTQNAAFLPDTKQAIAVNNVNAGVAGSLKDGTSCQLTNSAYFVDNGNGSGKTGTQLDGFTTPLTASLGGLQAKQRYHVKLALADTGDQAYDSAAFFKWLTSTSSSEVDLELTSSAMPIKPDRNGIVDLTYTVSNKSTIASRLVTAKIELPSGLEYLSDNSAGLFNAQTGEWSVDKVLANSKRMITIRAKVGTNTSYYIPAELTYSFNEDPDSTPYNRLAKPKEDDTATLTLMTISNTAPSINNDPNANHQPEDAKDSDKDGMPDYLDKYDLHAPDKDNDGDGLTNAQEAAIGSNPDSMDSDQDGLPDNLEVGKTVSTPADQDGDRIPDLIDPDDDGDSVPTLTENGGKASPSLDLDKDGVFDYLDTDDDNDSVPTKLENYNGGTAADDDTDQDGIPNYLDKDDDGDLIQTWYENYNGNTPTDDDTDQDATPDYLDADDDNDKLLTKFEQPDPNGNGNPDDGIDSDKDGIHNYRDLDDDNDRISTRDEKPDPNNDGNPADAMDEDLDEIPDYLDPVVNPYIRLSLRAFLQGVYSSSTGLMADDLRRLGYLPKQQPYGSLSSSFGYTNSLNAASPFGHIGQETLADTIYNRTGNEAVVDWVLIELRDATAPEKRIMTHASALLRNGQIVDGKTGSKEIVIHDVKPGNYYVALDHRNHLGVMTASPMALSTVSTLIDFTTPKTATYGKNAQLANSTMAMLWAGDVNNSNTIITNGPGSDLNVILGALLISPANLGVNTSYLMTGYFATDINLDGVTIYAGPKNDTNLLLGNVLLHPGNTTYNANYIINGAVPVFK